MIGTEVPASPERRQRREGRGRDGRSDLHRQAMRRSFGFELDQPEEAPEEPFCLARNAASLGSRRRESGLVQEGPQKGRTRLRIGITISEATPELVSQDRGAEDLRVDQADEHRQILRSAQMGAGSNAGPHFSLGATSFARCARLPGASIATIERAAGAACESSGPAASNVPARRRSPIERLDRRGRVSTAMPVLLKGRTRSTRPRSIFADRRGDAA